jgi:glucosamine--fructose-6-phosphate aminotransferase (isomerizing)
VTAAAAGVLMRAEIAEQPEAVARTIDATAPQAAALAAAARSRDVRSVVLLARGSSDHAALYGRYLLEGRCGLLSSLAAPSLYTTYRAPVDLSRTLALAVSQSGEVPEIVEALGYARSRGALVAALTNSAGSPLAAAADHAIVTQAGPERAVAATKTFTTQLAALAALAVALGARDLAAPLARAPGAIERTLACQAPVLAAAASLRGERAAVCLARGYSFCIALEAALKLKETAGLWAEGFSTADLRHGPTVAAGALPALVFHAPGRLANDVEALERALAAAGSRVVSIGAGRELPVDGALPEELAPLALVVPAQLLCERLAVLLGRDPDRPPGLHKVTQT